MSTPLLDAARAYRRDGFLVIPIPHGAKAPTLSNWQSLALGEAELDAHFNGRGNLGVLLSASGLADVDLDTPEAAALAPRFLPPTRTFGRPSKPASHRLYRVAEARATERYQVRLDGKVVTLVEYRSASTKGTPVQTVFPPSVHPSGELIAWEGDAALAEVDAADLARRVGVNAGCAVLAMLYPRGSGGRHDAAGALASVLARSAVPAFADVPEVVATIATLAGDPEAADRARFAADTLDALRRGAPATGQPTLRDLCSTTPEEGKALDKALGWIGFDGARAVAMPEAPEADPPGAAVRAEADDDDGRRGGRRSAATVLVELVSARAELWHDAEGLAYLTATTPAGGRENYPMRSRLARRYIERTFYESEGRAPGAQSTDDALGVLEGKAVFEGPEHRTAVRVAETTDDAGGVRLFLDLGDDTGRVVETTAGGWHVVDPEACPVRFIRRPGLLPLPVPVPGGAVEELRAVVNATPVGFALLVAWLLCALRGRGPYPILGFSGEQGTGKSTAARYVRALVDPNVANLRDLPRNAREAYISAAASHVLVYDNVSTIQPSQSDVLCRLATGGGYAVRALNTDADEAIFNESCPQVLTGIGDVVTRPDLAERTLAVPLERIADADRQTEGELDAAFEVARPRVLGALLDAAADGLRLLPTTRPGRLPRLADAARWIIACEAGGRIGAPGGFLRAFDGAREELVEAALDADPVASLIRALRDEWAAGLGRAAEPGEVFFRGTLQKLLDDLTSLYRRGDDKRRMPAGWPQTARGLSGAIARASPPLRAVGIDPTKPTRERNDRARELTLRTLPEQERLQPTEPADRPHPQQNPRREARNSVAGAADGAAGSTNRPANGAQPADQPAEPKEAAGDPKGRFSVDPGRSAGRPVASNHTLEGRLPEQLPDPWDPSPFV